MMSNAESIAPGFAVPRKRVLLLACLFCLPAVVVRSAAAEAPDVPEAVPVDGEPFQADVGAIDAQWQVTFNAAGKRRVLSAGELVCWGTCAEPGRGPLVVLADGGLLAADVLQADQERLRADAALFGPVELPLEWIAGAVFLAPPDRQARDRLLERVASAGGHSDRVTLANGDEISGRLEAIRHDALSVQTDGGPLKIEMHRVRAVTFNPALRPRVDRRGLRAWAGFSDGSRLVADQLIVEGESLRITLAGGLTWTTAAEELTCLVPLGGRVTYLSDLKANEYRHVPFLELPWPNYGTDRNVTGGLLRSGGRLYLKGLGMHSASRLTYLLAEPYSRFQAALAIDDQTGGRGSVRFRVYVDGRQQYASPIVRGGSAPLPIEVDISGAKRLDLIVDYADRADELDHANWLGARLVR